MKKTNVEITEKTAAFHSGTAPEPQTESTKSDLLIALLKNANLLNNEEAAAYLGVSPRSLEVWRCTKRIQIPFIKVGRLVKYRKTSLDAYLESQTVNGGAS